MLTPSEKHFIEFSATKVCPAIFQRFHFGAKSWLDTLREVVHWALIFATLVPLLQFVNALWWISLLNFVHYSTRMLHCTYITVKEDIADRAMPYPADNRQAICIGVFLAFVGVWQYILALHFIAEMLGSLFVSTGASDVIFFTLSIYLFEFSYLVHWALQATDLECAYFKCMLAAVLLFCNVL